MGGRPAHLLLVLLVCMGVYWPLLGRSGFASTEGHRVIPGWTMAETGRWGTVELFGREYVRKPPAMPWLIGVSASAFGETELSARAVSASCATLMALSACLFAGAWFGAPWGLAAGLMQALTPLFWGPGRGAEIEALNALATQWAALGMVGMLGAPGRRGGDAGAARGWTVRDAAGVIACGLAVALLLLSKGPAGVPVVAAVPLGACVARRSWRPLFSGRAWGAAAIGAATAAALLWPFLEARNSDEAVSEGVSRFLWSAQAAPRVAMLMPAAFAAAMPASLALVFPWGSDAAREGDAERAAGGDSFTTARTLAAAWIIAVAGCTLAGVSNPRYTIPAAVLLPPLAAWAARGGFAAVGVPGAGGFGDRRRTIARWAFAGRPAALFAALLLGAWCAIALIDWRSPGGAPSGTRERSSGRAAGLALGDEPALGDGAVVWADDLIEARPEVLLYAQRGAARRGRTLTPLWMKPRMLRAELPPAGAFLLLRTDGESPEAGRYAPAVADGRLTPVATGQVYKYEFALYRVGEPASPALSPR